MSTVLTTMGASAKTSLASFRNAVVRELIPFDPRQLHNGRTIADLNVTFEKSISKTDAAYTAYAANLSDENLSSLLTEVQRYGKRILMRGGYHTRVDIDDVVQSALVAIWQQLKMFSGRSTFRSWCHRIIINTAIDEIRRQDRLPECSLPLDEDGNVNNDILASPNHYIGARRAVPVEHDSNSETEYIGGGHAPLLNVYGDLDDWIDDAAEQHYQSDFLDRVIPLLSENHRIVTMLYRRGYTPQQIADILGEKPKWVSNQLTLARAALREAAELAEKMGYIELPKQNRKVKRLSNEEEKKTLPSRVLTTAAD